MDYRNPGRPKEAPSRLQPPSENKVDNPDKKTGLVYVRARRFPCFKTRFNAEALSRIARAMANEIRQPGPDDSGVQVDQFIGLAFGFRRLSIIDVSQAGHQPTASASGRTMMIYNGEMPKTCAESW
jgi:hypothetical protein